MNIKRTPSAFKSAASLALGLCLGLVSQSQTGWYVSKVSGHNSNDGLSPSTPFETVEYAVDFLQAGDTLFIMGEYTNDSYIQGYSYGGNINDPHIWMDEHTIRITGLHGSQDNYITFKAYDNNTLLKGDAANILRITNSSYLTIEGLEFYGEVDNIPLSTALALQFLYRDPETGEVLYRVPPGTPDEVVETMTFPVLGSVQRPSYTDTRGLYLSDVHHIIIRGNTIHHMPGGGLRVADCEYIDISENEIHDCSRKSYSGTHALVVTKATSTDEEDNYKVNILRNLVHHNYNEIYSWSPLKSFITPRIDEGKGISLQRNNLESWSHGRFLVANNVCYWNGFSGVHTNEGKRMDFINNTCYLNSYTNTVTYAGEEQMGKNIGISSQYSEDIRVLNNTVYIDNAWGGYPVSISNTTDFEVSDNLVFGMNGPLAQDPEVIPIQVNTYIADPLFVDPGSNDFSLLPGSPAIDMADPAYAPDVDYFGNARDENPDLGAIEYDSNLALPEEVITEDFKIYPNPFTDVIHIRSEERIYDLGLFAVTGQRIPITVKGAEISRLNLSSLPQGIYLIKINHHWKRIIKR